MAQKWVSPYCHGCFEMLQLSNFQLKLIEIEKKKIGDVSCTNSDRLEKGPICLFSHRAADGCIEKWTGR